MRKRFIRQVGREERPASMADLFESWCGSTETGFEEVTEVVPAHIVFDLMLRLYDRKILTIGDLREMTHDILLQEAGNDAE